MGEIADDCYDRAAEELEFLDSDPFYGCGPENTYWPARQTSHSTRQGMQFVGRVQRVLPLEIPENRDWMFITIDKKWPFSSHNFLVQQPDLISATTDFFENEFHQPFRADQAVPNHTTEVHPQNTGGWIVHGETQTVLIFSR